MTVWQKASAVEIRTLKKYFNKTVLYLVSYYVIAWNDCRKLKFPSHWLLKTESIYYLGSCLALNSKERCIGNINFAILSSHTVACFRIHSSNQSWNFSGIKFDCLDLKNLESYGEHQKNNLFWNFHVATSDKQLLMTVGWNSDPAAQRIFQSDNVNQPPNLFKNTTFAQGAIRKLRSILVYLIRQQNAYAIK